MYRCIVNNRKCGILSKLKISLNQLAQPADLSLATLLIDHAPVSVTWPLIQTSLLLLWKSSCSYVPVNSKTAHAPPLRAFDFFEKFWSNSPLCCQFRRSKSPPVRASKRVKSPTLQASEANCGNKFCKIFTHFEFLIQLVFAPNFKQRHIPRCNYIKRLTTEKPTWNRQEQCPANAAHLLNQRIAKSFCFRPLTNVLTRKSNAPPGGPRFGSNSPLYGALRE